MTHAARQLEPRPSSGPSLLAEMLEIHCAPVEVLEPPRAPTMAPAPQPAPVAAPIAVAQSLPPPPPPIDHSLLGLLVDLAAEERLRREQAEATLASHTAQTPTRTREVVGLKLVVTLTAGTMATTYDSPVPHLEALGANLLETLEELLERRKTSTACWLCERTDCPWRYCEATDSWLATSTGGWLPA